MFSSTVLTLLSMALLGRAADIPVHVGATEDGASALVFDPANVTAKVGDNIEFIFHPKNHSVVQSTFANPCTRLPLNSTTGIEGFTTGFQPAQASDTDLTKITLRVNSTSPIWAYCSQATHCQSGMVFAINAPETGNTFDKFVANAKASGSSSGAYGTSSGTSSGPSSTGTPNSGSGGSGAAGSASSVQTAAGALAVAVFSVLFALTA